MTHRAGLYISLLNSVTLVSIVAACADVNDPQTVAQNRQSNYGTDRSDKSQTVSTATSATKQPTSKKEPVQSANWPRFRGPNGSGISTERGIASEWSDTKNIHWKFKLPGVGCSSPITYGDHVYVTCYSGYGLNRRAPGDKSKLKRHLVCLQLSTGRHLWTQEMKANGHEHAFESHLASHGYATHTPTADKSGVYVFYGASGAAKYSHEGKLIWHESCGTKNVDSGSTSSLVLVGDLLVVNSTTESFTLRGLNRKTGRLVWKHGYYAGCTPIIRKSKGVDELVFRPNKVLNAKSGQALWTFKGNQGYGCPAVNGDSLFFADHDRIYALKIQANGEPKMLWELKPGTQTVTPLFYKGYLYWVKHEGGIACCADAKTGELKYRKRLTPPVRAHWASPVLANGKIYYVSRDHGTHVVAAEPKFKILAYNTISSDKGRWVATPAISRGRLLLRSRTTLYSIRNQ